MSVPTDQEVDYDALSKMNMATVFAAYQQYMLNLSLFGLPGQFPVPPVADQQAPVPSFIPIFDVTGPTMLSVPPLPTVTHPVQMEMTQQQQEVLLAHLHFHFE